MIGDCESKIDQFHNPALCYQNILQLYVPVGNVLVMDIADCVYQLSHDGPGLYF
jgi:hypothetical protein